MIIRMIWYIIFHFIFNIYQIQCNFLETISIIENTFYSQPLLDLEKVLRNRSIITNDKQQKYKIYSIADKSSSFSLIDNKLSITSNIDREAICPGQTELHRFDPLLESSNNQLTRNSCKTEECCFVFSFQVDTGNRISSFYILIKISDQNDNIPKFLPFSNPYINLLENSPVNTVISLPSAIDLDSEAFGIKHYTVIKPFLIGNDSHFMMLDKMNSGRPQMVLIAPLDREQIPEYRFHLKAIDRENDDLREISGVEVEIKIGDVNDNYPLFDKTFYTANIIEHSKQNNIISFYVTDLDEGQNKQVSISIETENEISKNQIKNLFQIEFSASSMTGIIRLIDEMDYETNPSKYSFNLIATDNGRPALSSSAKVVILILNKNDHAPRIKVIRKGEIVTRSITINENEPAKTIVASLQVSDRDSPVSDIECSIDDFTLNFDISPLNELHPLGHYKEFIITTLRPLDREDENNQYLNIKIYCSDHDKLSSLSTNLTILINLFDINDNPPIFTRSKYQGELMENIQHAPVKMNEPVQTFDKDHGKNAYVTYKIDQSKNSSDWEYFTIDQDSGRISSKFSIDYEKSKMFTFNIIAIDKDQSNLSSTALIIVRIIDANDNAPIFAKSHYSFTVTENVPVNTEIGQIETSDNDTKPENKIVKYYHKSYTNNHQIIHVDQNSGKLKTIGPIDREKIRTLSILITARNEANYQNKNLMDPECMVVITVEDVNDNPPVFSLINPSKSSLYFNINKNNRQENCQLIPYVVSDADHDEPNSDSCCALQLDNDYNGLLYLLSNTPNLLCLQNSAITPATYRVFLTATDNKNNPNKSLKAKVSFNIILRNEFNENPIPERNDNKISTKKHQYSYQSRFSLVIIIIVVVIVCILIITFVLLIFYRYLSYNPDNLSNIYDKSPESLVVQPVDKNATQMKLYPSNYHQNIWIPEDLRLIPTLTSETKDAPSWTRSIKNNEWINEKNFYPNQNQDSYQISNPSEHDLIRSPNVGYEALCLVTSSGHEYFSVDGKEINTISVPQHFSKSIDNTITTSIPNYKENEIKYCQTSFV